MSRFPSFDPGSILSALHRHGVDHLLIGGLAAVARQSPYHTGDVDICPLNSDANLERLTAALEEVHARRVADLVPEGELVSLSPNYLKAENELAFMTDFGRLDLIFVPMGTRGYTDLKVEATTEDVSGIPVMIASTEDIIRMKDARGLPKDRLAVDVLRQLKDRKHR